MVDDDSFGPGYLLKRAQSALRAQMDATLRPIGLTTPQFAVLDALHRSDAGLSNAELARQSFVSAQTMHRIVVGLEKRELIERPEDPSLGRLRLARHTQAGRKLHRQAHRLVSKIVTYAFADLSEKERDFLAEALGSIADRLETL